MSCVLICREAVEDSVLGNLALGRAMAGRGEEVIVLFTGEALHALDKGTFQWSRNFKTRTAQAGVIAAAEKAGLRLAHPDLDPRWSDIRNLVASLSGEAGLRLVACPIWLELLGLDDAPGSLERIDQECLTDILNNAKTIVGGY